MRHTFLLLACVLSMGASECAPPPATAEAVDTRSVQRQQSQYSKRQPVPHYDWSLERDLLIQLYGIRNQRVSTYSVWRSDYGTIEGDCPSMGYGLPYDTSLTNPWVATDIDSQGEEHHYQGGALTSIGQPEPNGIYASTNTSATWVMCVGPGGQVEPVYVEAKVTVYPGLIEVDYRENRVHRVGGASVTLSLSQ